MNTPRCEQFKLVFAVLSNIPGQVVRDRNVRTCLLGSDKTMGNEILQTAVTKNDMTQTEDYVRQA